MVVIGIYGTYRFGLAELILTGDPGSKLETQETAPECIGEKIVTNMMRETSTSCGEKRQK